MKKQTTTQPRSRRFAAVSSGCAVTGNKPSYRRAIVSGEVWKKFNSDAQEFVRNIRTGSNMQSLRIPKSPKLTAALTMLYGWQEFSLTNPIHISRIRAALGESR